jgi:hypothetical protein
MTTRTRLLLGAAAIASTIVTIVHATPIVGLLVGTILSSGTTTEDIMQKVHVPLPPSAGLMAERVLINADTGIHPGLLNSRFRLCLCIPDRERFIEPQTDSQYAIVPIHIRRAPVIRDCGIQSLGT